MPCLRALVIVIHAVAKPRSVIRLYCQMLLRSRAGPFNFTIQFLSGSSTPASHPPAYEMLATAATATAMMPAKRSERFIQLRSFGVPDNRIAPPDRSEEHTSELQHQIIS